ncbi:MAG: ATP-binding protein [Bacteroidota bacterium]
MAMTKNNAHIEALEREMDWFGQLLNLLFHRYFEEDNTEEAPPLPEHDPEGSYYGQLLAEFDWGLPERMALMLALAPNLRPNVLDVFFTKNALYDRPFTEFGGVQSKQHGGFIPTGETLSFLLSGNFLENRWEVLELFGPHHPFSQYHIIELGVVSSGEPRLSGLLQLSTEYLARLTTGEQSLPEYDSQFPAVRIHTELEWEDLVLDEYVGEEIDHIRMWLERGSFLLEDMGLKKHLKPGYRSLFHGPPGTGKTLTACLLGKSTNRPVYRIDLSMVVSKYIGETEKNLKRVFDQAEHQDWILFFDEADSLFGKRTSTRSSNDRYANQEVAYLLQRVEDFPGVVILASNLSSNMDEAFLRRFQSQVYFPIPSAESRYEIWKGIFSGAMRPAADLDLYQLAQDHALAGGTAINVFRYGALRAAARNETVIQQDDIRKGIARELQKEGKTIPTNR